MRNKAEQVALVTGANRGLGFETARQLLAKGLVVVYITTLEAVIDVSALDPGDYQLTLRREGGEWQMFPLRVR